MKFTIRDGTLALLATFCVVSVLFLSGCGGGGGSATPGIPDPEPEPPEISIRPVENIDPDVPLFVFGDAVSEEDRETFRNLAYSAMNYLEDETGITLTRNLTYYAYTDRENFIRDYVEFRNRTPYATSPLEESDLRRTLRERQSSFGYEFWGTFDNTAIFIYGEHYLSSDRRLLHVIAHEHYHAIQTFGIIGQDGIRHIGPEWLIEGSARYVEAWTLETAGYALTGPLTDLSREGDLRWAKMFSDSLESIATVEGFFFSGKTGDEVFMSYVLGRFAAELLINEYGGLKVVTEFYRAIDEETTWQEAFESTFGIDIDTFYQEFREYREGGFE